MVRSAATPRVSNHLAAQTIGSSVQLDAGLADQFCPVLVFGRDEGLEPVVREIPCFAVTLLEPLLKVGQRSADIPAQPCDHLRRCSGGCENSEPGIDIETGHA